MAVITGIIRDQPPAAERNILELARPITDIDGVTASNWLNDCGIDLLYTCGCVGRWPNQSDCRRRCPRVDEDNNEIPIESPDWWPVPIDQVNDGTGFVPAFPDGAPPRTGNTLRAAPFAVGRASRLLDVGDNCTVMDPRTAVQSDMEAHLAAVVGAELFDGQGTLSPSLMDLATPLGDGQLLGSSVGLSQLVRNAGQPGGMANSHYSLGDYVITMPAWAADVMGCQLRWDDENQQHVNRAGIPVWFVEGHPNLGPYEIEGDYTSGRGALDGEAWAYIHPRPYVGVGPLEVRDAGELNGNVVAAHATQRYIVIFKPCRIYAAKIDLNKSC